ncbi:uncharacterized protein METZ01_LOCUS195673 [marine metagenome]|uniref:Uncharacterized protein n=1 Tax=marine metagenome TaxID=408172 RepID=A0A382DXC9_9ZZZZ
MEPVDSVGFFYLINKQHLLNLFSLLTPYNTLSKYLALQNVHLIE